MTNRLFKNWPSDIDQDEFISNYKVFTHEELTKLYGCSLHRVKKMIGWLRLSGLLPAVTGLGGGSMQQVPTINKTNQGQFIADTFTMGNRDLAKKYGIAVGTVTSTKYRLTLQGHTIGHGAFPKPLGRSFNDQLRLEIDRFIVMGDSEIPDHDPEWFELVVALAEAWGIKDLIINGDFVALDSLSSWMKQLARHQTFEDELQAAKEALTAFSKTFDNIYYLQANHERRLAHAIEGQMSFGSQLKDLFGVTVSEYPYCWVTSNGEEYLICHPDNYSRIPLSVPLALSNINHKHLIVGHTHRLAEGRSKSGDYRIIEGGHMRDLEKTAYKTLRINTHPAWNPGFVAVIDGLPWILDKEKALFFIEGFKGGRQ